MNILQWFFKRISRLLFAKDSLKISEELEKIGYFNLIANSVKLSHLKYEIDEDYYTGKSYGDLNWLILTNDYYISGNYELQEYGNKSSTSDFRAFAVSADYLYRSNLEMYLNEAKAVFERNGLKLDWKDEYLDVKKESGTVEIFHHTIRINEKEYLLYSGNVRDITINPSFDYLTNFRQILKQVLKEQKSNHNLILLTSPEDVYFILLEPEMMQDFKKIIAKTKNKIVD